MSTATTYDLAPIFVKGFLFEDPEKAAPILDLSEDAPRTVRYELGKPLHLRIPVLSPDGDRLTIAGQGAPRGLKLTPLQGGFELSWTPTTEQAGPYEVSFVVSDGHFTTKRSVMFCVTKTTRIEDDSPAIIYVPASAWLASKHSCLSGGGAMLSDVPLATAALRFKGAGVRWITTKGPMQGQADVLLDGVWVRTIDLYNATLESQVVAFSAEVTTKTEHTIEVRVLGTSDAGSMGSVVTIDAFEVAA
jgi:hypothetical protein